MSRNVFPCYGAITDEKKKCYVEQRDIQIPDTQVEITICVGFNSEEIIPIS